MGVRVSVAEYIVGCMSRGWEVVSAICAGNGLWGRSVDRQSVGRKTYEEVQGREWEETRRRVTRTV